MHLSRFNCDFVEFDVKILKEQRKLQVIRLNIQP